MKNILIVEDNPITSKALSEAIYEDVKQDIKVYIASKAEEAYAILLFNRIDVFVIDIILNPHITGDVSGLKLAAKIRKHEMYMFTPLIFITVLMDPEFYTYRELHSFGYLEKPFSMKKATELICMALKAPSKAEEKEEFYFRKDGILYAVKINDIVYVEVRNHIMSVYMTKEILKIPYITIKTFLKDVDNRLFLQCNRSTLVGKKFIKYIDLSNKCIGLINPYKTVDIGPTFYKQILREVKDDFYN